MTNFSMKTQEMQVLDYIRKHGSITQLQATLELGITRLSARIWTLRHKLGFEIRDEYIEVPTRNGGTARVKRYYI